MVSRCSTARASSGDSPTISIALNAQSPGLCPPYPGLGLPACVVMEVYFVLMLASLIVSNRRVGRAVFYAAGTIAFVSASAFSVREVLDIAQCPRLFDIPLPMCFTVVPTVVLMLFLKFKGHTAPSAILVEGVTR